MNIWTFLDRSRGEILFIFLICLFFGAIGAKEGCYHVKAGPFEIGYSECSTAR